MKNDGKRERGECRNKKDGKIKEVAGTKHQTADFRLLVLPPMVPFPV